MKVLKNKRKGYTVSLEIETSQDEISIAMDTAFKKIVKKAKVPGFRQGKIPRHIFEKHYGKDYLVQEAISEAVNTAYSEAVQELTLPVVDYPKNVNIGEYKVEKPVVFTCEVDVKPEVKLGKYKGLKTEKPSEDVTKEEIDEQIMKIREQAASYEQADRAIKDEDILRIHLDAKIDGETYEPWSRQNVGLKTGAQTYSEDFDKELIGLKATDKKEFSISYADDYTQKDVAGKTVAFSVEIIEVRERSIPEISDELVAKLSEHKTVDEFTTNLKESLSKQKQQASEEAVKGSIMESVIEDIKVDIPQSMIESEIDADMREYQSNIERSGMKMQDYFQAIGKTEADFREELKGNAEKKVKMELTIDTISEKEKIEVTDQDLKEEIKRLVPTLKSDEEIDEHLKKVNQEGFKKIIQRRKTVDFLVSHAKLVDKK